MGFTGREIKTAIWISFLFLVLFDAEAEAKHLFCCNSLELQ